MSDTIADSPRAASSETLVVACPADASLNRVPRARLDHNPKCGRCHKPLFEGSAVELNAANAVTPRNGGFRLDVDLAEPHARLQLPRCSLESGRHQPAGTAPFRPEVDHHWQVALKRVRLEIRGIPSMVMIRKRREIARTSGAMPTSAIVHWVEEALHRV